MGQAMNKLKKAEPTEEQQNKLTEDLQKIIDEVYDVDFAKGIVNFDDFYHAIFKITQKLSEKRGEMQYKLQSKEELQKIFTKYKKGTELSKDECGKIINETIKLENFSMGQGAINILLYVFGAPILALVAKRIIPGMKSIPDDVVIPIATSGSVVLLAKSNKL
ncbi:hypothetical protein LUZ60_003678 [Juncus effusus]|nr:hypothetical protein LUZ60_003678 [Juncus effusus]